MSPVFRSEKGLSIIETMIALLISTIILAGLLHIFLTSKKLFSLETVYTQMQDNARYAAAHISRSLRLAGYRTPPKTNTAFSDFSVVFPKSSNYIDGTYQTGAHKSDTLIVRYEGSGDGAGHPDGTIRDCLNRPVDANVVATNTFSITDNNELQCQANNPSASPRDQTEILVSGIETMKILYGEDLDLSNSAERYVPENFSGLSTERIVSVRVGLLLVSEDLVEMLHEPKTYYLNGTSYTEPDNRHARQPVIFTTVLRNKLKNAN